MSDLKMREEFEVWAVKDAASTDKTLSFERGGEWYLGKDHQVMNLGWAAWQASREALVIEPVLGDQLPPVGSKVQIHLGRSDAWIEHIVAGYYVWGDLGGNESLSRVFVRVRDESGYLNARPLKDVRPVVASVLGETVSVPKELCHE